MPQEFPRATAAEMAGQTISLHTGQSADELALLLPPKARQRLEILTLRAGGWPSADSRGRHGARRECREIRSRACTTENVGGFSPAGHLLHPDDLRVVVAEEISPSSNGKAQLCRSATRHARRRFNQSRKPIRRRWRGLRTAGRPAPRWRISLALSRSSRRVRTSPSRSRGCGDAVEN